MESRKQWEWDGNSASNQSAKGLGTINGGRGSQGLYEASTVQHFPLGYRLAFDDGRVFRYGAAISACPAGKLVATDVTYGALGEAKVGAICDSAGTATADYTSDTDGKYTRTTWYVKDTDIFKSTVTDDMLAGGYFHICKNAHQTAAQGATFRIRTNDYTASTSIVKLSLMDAVPFNIGSEAEIAVTANAYRALCAATYSTDTIVVGVPIVAIAAGSFGWVQTWGVATCLADGTIAAGSIVTLSDGTQGAMQEFAGAKNVSEIAAASDYDDLSNFPIIGFCVSLGTSTSYQPVYLQLAP